MPRPIRTVIEKTTDEATHEILRPHDLYIVLYDEHPFIHKKTLTGNKHPQYADHGFNATSAHQYADELNVMFSTDKFRAVSLNQLITNQKQ